MTAQEAQQPTGAALCVLSFDGASDLWHPFFDGLKSAWPDLDLPIYLVTNYKEYAGAYSVTTLAIGEDVDWSSNLLRALKRIKERHILFIFDDFVLRSANNSKIRQYLDQAIANDWPYLTLHPNNYMTEKVAPGVRAISEYGIYRCTLVYGIFRKDILREVLEPGENAWEFEIESGARLRGVPLRSADAKVFRHYHLLRKGTGLRPGYPVLAKRYDLRCDRPVESRIEYAVREIKEWIFRCYHRTLPPRWIEWRENRRRT